jgi:hypothetical protein
VAANSTGRLGREKKNTFFLKNRPNEFDRGYNAFYILQNVKRIFCNRWKGRVLVRGNPIRGTQSDEAKPRTSSVQKRDTLMPAKEPVCNGRDMSIERS